MLEVRGPQVLREKLLSICILTYNRVATLEETLASILPQVENDRRLEVVVCDNASTDGTQAFALAYARLHPSVRYHRNPNNKGFDGNVVTCVEQAQGEYVGFFSDDDIALPGTFERILHEIESRRPAIVYLNHYPFRDNNARRGLRWKMPKEDLMFDSGKAFFLFAGLGFISALTVKTEYARGYLGDAKFGPGQAHLDIASRICLFHSGPFVFVGTKAIAARIPATARWDWLVGCGIAESEFYHGLETDGVLDAPTVRHRVSGSIRHNILGLVVFKKCLGDHRELATQKDLLVSVYGRYTSFWLLVYPILLAPRPLLRPPYLILRALLHTYRKLRYGMRDVETYQQP